MKVWLLVTGLLVLGCQRTSSLDWTTSVSTEALTEPTKIMQVRCASCHNANKGEGNFANANDLSGMIASGLVVPGNPDESRLYVVMKTAFMPPNLHLGEEEVEAIRNWIAHMDPYASDPKYKFDQLEADVLKPACISCHGATSTIPLVTYDDVLKYVVIGNHNYSLLYETVRAGAGGHAINGDQRKVIREWINRGARKAAN